MAESLQKPKIIITGKNGQLAKEFASLFEKQKIPFLAFTKKDFDITNEKLVYKAISEYKPNFVINCAAYNYVDKAEEEKALATKTNTIGPKNLALACKKTNSLLIHFSTDYVFDGEKQSPYEETDKPNPLNFYGKTKLEGEKEIQSVFDNYLILRVSWLYGKGKNNFVLKFLNWCNNNQTVKIADNETSIPTSAKTVAEFSLKAMEKNLTGLYHLTNSGHCSRFELALKIKEIMNLPNEIIPVNSSVFSLKAKRPKFSVMDNSLISKKLDIQIPEWEHDLEKFLKELQ